MGKLGSDRAFCTSALYGGLYRFISPKPLQPFAPVVFQGERVHEVGR